MTGFIAVDWGTSNRRAYRVGADGVVVDVFEDGLGVLEVPAGGFAREVAGLRARLGGGPVLMAGMVGSNRGWVEAAYVPCPAGLAALAAAVRWVEPDVGIVPGVSLSRDGRADVMRGEETQALGAVAGGLMAADGVVCHPGTHCKWIVLAGGELVDFRTVMTGEVFALLRGGGILAPQLGGEVADGPAFAEGVRVGLAEPVLAALFGVRARALLGGLDDAASYASGVLIGADVAAGLAMAGERPLALVGRPELCALYAAALGVAGREAVAIDGAGAFVAGMRAVMERV